MTTADAKVELVKRAIESAFIAKHKTAIGPSYAETAARAAITALEASHSRTETITPEMFEAGNAAQHPDDCTDVRAIYTAMQAARLIDRQNEGVPASPSGCQPSASAAEEASSRSGIPNAETIDAGIEAALSDPWIKLDIDADGLRQSGFVERIFAAMQGDLQGVER